MTIIELHNQGIIQYLFNKGIVSSSLLSYIDYYQQFVHYRTEGKTYRETVRLLATKHQVSETTIKKAVRLMARTATD